MANGKGLWKAVSSGYGSQLDMEDEKNCVLELQDIIIINFYFEYVTFFHAKLRSNVCPRVDNQTSGDTLQDLTRPLSGKIAISQSATHGYWRVLVVRCPQWRIYPSAMAPIWPQFFF